MRSAEKETIIGHLFKGAGGKMIVEAGLLLVIAGMAMMMDLRWMRVDNGWIFCSLVSGLRFQLWTNGIRGPGIFFAGAAFPIVVLGILFYFRMLGAGDIKVFCALGGIMGIEKIGICMAVSFILGAGISFFILIFYGDIHQRIQYFFRYLRDYFFTGKVRPYYRRGMTVENFHFTVPVFMSVLLYTGGVY